MEEREGGRRERVLFEEAKETCLSEEKWACRDGSGQQKTEKQEKKNRQRVSLRKKERQVGELQKCLKSQTPE